MVVGPPIAFDDLFDEYRRRCVLSEKRAARAAAAAVGEEVHQTVVKEGWAATGREERRLYAAITRRIEGALRELEIEANAFHCQVHGEAPPVFVDADAEAEVRAAERAEARWRRWQRWRAPVLGGR